MMQPVGGAQELLGQAEIDQIAGDRDMVGIPLEKVAGERVEERAPMHQLPPAMPVHIAEDALRQEMAALGPRHRAQVNVGEMGESEHGAGGFCDDW